MLLRGFQAGKPRDATIKPTLRRIFALLDTGKVNA